MMALGEYAKYYDLLYAGNRNLEPAERCPPEDIEDYQAFRRAQKTDVRAHVKHRRSFSETPLPLLESSRPSMKPAPPEADELLMNQVSNLLSSRSSKTSELQARVCE